MKANSPTGQLMQPMRFPLAPMSRGILVLTLALLTLPIGLLILAAQAGGDLALVPAGLVILIYLYVWLYLRPTRFELLSDELRIVWPLRREAFPLFDVTKVELLTGRQFRSRYGWGLRVGAGGLGGGFGLLLTRQGTLRFYVSRLDGYVLIHNRSTRPLLITPSDPEAFVRAMQASRGEVSAS